MFTLKNILEKTMNEELLVTDYQGWDEMWWGWDFDAYLRRGRKSCYFCHQFKDIKFYYYLGTTSYSTNQPVLVTWCGCANANKNQIIQELSDKDMFSVRILNGL